MINNYNMKKIILTKKKIIYAAFLSQEGHIASSFSVLNILNILVKYFIFKSRFAKKTQMAIFRCENAAKRFRFSNSP